MWNHFDRFWRSMPVRAMPGRVMPGRRRDRRLAQVLAGFVLSWALVLHSDAAVWAAEQISLRYGMFGTSIAIADIETFAETGVSSRSLDRLLSQLSEPQQSQVQQVLQTQFQVSPTIVSQFSYTGSGEQLLREAGALIQTAAGQNGFSSLRSAAILAAADPQGFSLLTFLNQLPTNIQINIAQALQLKRQVTALVAQTQQATAKLKQQTIALANAAPPIDFAKLPDLRQSGPLDTTVQTFTWRDRQRQRSITGDLYLPPAAEQPAALVLISNGLGARRDRFTPLAEHLASHGFAVVALDHPGSDRERLQAFQNGLYRENFDASDFVERPRDISFILDQLNESFSDRIDVNRSGVFGYSFGGTTALSLAGAEMQPAALRQACNYPERPFLFNISLLYQCRALELPELPTLRDRRIQAIYAFVPFGKSLFNEGLQQVAVPTLWEASDLDVLAPLVIEQLPGFAQLTNADRYLVVSQGLPHARINHELLSGFTASKSASWTELKQLSNTYVSALSLAFFQVYLNQDDRYRDFLGASYVQALGQAPYWLSWSPTATGT